MPTDHLARPDAWKGQFLQRGGPRKAWWRDWQGSGMCSLSPSFAHGLASARAGGGGMNAQVALGAGRGLSRNSVVQAGRRQFRAASSRW
jgi:hypothetical protein